MHFCNSDQKAEPVSPSVRSMSKVRCADVDRLTECLSYCCRVRFGAASEWLVF